MLATDIARGIVEREIQMGLRVQGDGGYCRVKPGVADSQIFAAENGNCIAVDFKSKVRLDDGIQYKGIQWLEADKRPGSRATGWVQMRQMLKNAHPTVLGERDDGSLILGPREKPGLFIFSNCDNWARTVPVLPRDEDNPDDVNTDTEDHIADETRYKVRSVGVSVSGGTVSGQH